MTNPLAWGIMGAGSIAGTFAGGLAQSRTGRPVAVGSRTQAAADAFGETWQIPNRHGSYAGLLADERVQAVYIATPHPLHTEWAIKAAEAKKHILCEKPLALNAAETKAIIEAARRNDVFLMEAFMYRCHPQTQKLVELIRAGAIGQVYVIQATFSFRASYDPQSRLLNNALGGGGILDVGCYCVSMSRLVAGAATGQPFAEPTRVEALGHVGETGVDEYTIASLSFPGDILAQLFTGVRVAGENVVRIFGTEGSLLIPSPWHPRSDGAPGILLKRPGKPDQEIFVGQTPDVYTLEAETVAAHIDERQAPAMSWDDTLGNMQTLDRWRAALEVSYAAE
jgi:predicted dehydrogenase